MTLHDRIKKVVEYSKLNTSQFAKFVGFKTPQTVRSLLSGATKTLSYEVEQKLAKAFPEINRAWLVTGEGEMLGEADQPPVVAPTKGASRCYDVLTIQGGIGHGTLLDRITDKDVVVGHMMAPDLPVGDDIIYIKVRGNSMVNRNDPAHSIPDGAWVGIKKATSSAIRWGEVYAIMTTDGAVIKKVLKSDSPDTLRLASYNVEDGYMPFDLPVSEIIQPLFNVVGVVIANRWA